MKKRIAPLVASALATATVFATGASASENLTPAHDYLFNYPSGSEESFNEDVQGITHDAGNWFITEVDRLHKIPATADLANPPQHPSVGFPLSGYNHMGAPDYDNGYVFVPMYGDNASGIAVYRGSDLAFRGLVRLSFNPGWVAIRHTDHRLFTSKSTLGGASVGLSWQIDFTKLTGSTASPSIAPLVNGRSFRVYGRDGTSLTLEHMQGGTFSPRGDLYTMNGFTGCFQDRKVPASPVRRFRMVAPDVFHEVARSNNGYDPFNYEIHQSKDQEPQGLTWWDLSQVPHHYRVSGNLHALMLDNDCWDDDNVFLKHYRVSVS